MLDDSSSTRSYKKRSSIWKNEEDPTKSCRPIETSIQGIIEGWGGKAKGMLQILFERGKVDPAKMAEYTVHGKNDAFGNLMPETSLRHLMEQLSDFQDEETLLQYHGRKLGVKVDRTPKCHPEMAGEGIEYDWAAAKGFYRCLLNRETDNV
jgi:hypothetical protein